MFMVLSGEQQLPSRHPGAHPILTGQGPTLLEWLSDNGSAYIVRQTAQAAAALGIGLIFTPVRSPQSNGVSEAFVKTLKRDYASTVILPDAETYWPYRPNESTITVRSTRTLGSSIAHHASS